MVEIALLIGIFSYLVFGLGLVGGFEYLNILGILGGLGILGVLFFLFKKQKKTFNLLKFLEELKRDNVSLFVLILLLLSALVNLIGALGPELVFDALWYHLTIPKIYLQSQKIFFIPGGLFYYSAMPKLTEMLYLVSLIRFPGGELAKLIHYFFGILSGFSLYFLAKRYLNLKYSLIAVLLFYTSLIVGWESATAYIDLSRTFFEILALKLFLEWKDERGKMEKKGKVGKRRNIKLCESAIILGLAISTKLIAFVSLPIFLILILIKTKKVSLAVCYLLFAVLTVLPWLIFSFVNTGNPVFPIFAGILDQTHQFVTPSFTGFLKDYLNLFFDSDIPLNPVYFIFLLFFIINLLRGKLGDLGKYVCMALFFWYLTPKTGGTRFILPYLPALSVCFCLAVSNSQYFQKLFVYLVILCSFFNIGYRFLANYKFLPIILGKMTRNQFLVNNLNFNNNDFYDENNEIRDIVKDDLVLILGSHNLFYADFYFVHESYAPKGILYTYLLTQNTDLTEKYQTAKLIYNNNRTKVSLYLYGGELK